MNKARGLRRAPNLSATVGLESLAGGYYGSTRDEVLREVNAQCGGSDEVIRIRFG